MLKMYLQSLIFWLMPVLILIKIVLIIKICKGGKRIMSDLMAEKVEIECPICSKKLLVKKNYEEGGLRLHQLRDSKCKKIAKGCEHEWRLLDENVPRERRAIEAGYEEYCEICLRLREEDD